MAYEAVQVPVAGQSSLSPDLVKVTPSALKLAGGPNLYLSNTSLGAVYWQLTVIMNLQPTSKPVAAVVGSGVTIACPFNADANAKRGRPEALPSLTSLQLPSQEVNVRFNIKYKTPTWEPSFLIQSAKNDD
jgi:hypothetical protein